MPITQDPARLAAVASALGEASRSVGRGERVRLPVLKNGDAAGINFVMMAEFDDSIAERTAAIAKDAS